MAARSRERSLGPSSRVGAALFLAELRESALPPAFDVAKARRLREGTYQAGKSHVIYFQDGDTLRDAADLYAVLKEEADTGSPNLPNELARAWVEQMQAGQNLNNTQLAKLLELLKQYAPQIKRYRESSDRSQDILHVPDGSDARILR